MSSNLPATVSPAGFAPAHLTTLSITDLMRLAEVLVPTGFLPKTITTPAQATAVMLKGQELRVPPMYALAHISIINGKPNADAELMLALIERDHGQRAIRVRETSDDACTVEYRRDGWTEIQSYTFTIEQAKKAGLMSNPTWQKYPAAMLRARCISAVARMAFPGSIAGMYVPGELGDDVTVNDDGEVQSIAVTPTVTVDEDGVIQDASVSALAPRSAMMATRRQLEMASERWAALRLDPAKIDAQCRKWYGVRFQDLSRDDATDFIAKLDQKITASKQPEPSPALLSEAAAEPAGMDDEDFAQVVAGIDAERATVSGAAGADRFTD